MSKPNPWLVYATFPDKKSALRAAKVLLEKKLIACANIYSVTSAYRWEGKIQQSPETVLIAKTQKARVRAATAEVKRLHSYQVPCIIAYPIAEGFPPFLQWIAEETA